MKKDIEWLKKRFDEVVEFRKQLNPITSWGLGGNAVLECIKEDFKNLINKLDKPETLSQAWIDEHKEPIFDLGEDFETDFIKVEHVQNLLVPKQEGVEEGRVRLIVGFDGGTESYYATDIGDALDFLTDYDARFTVSKEPIIPKFVTDYIQEGKDLGCDLGTAMTVQTEMLKGIRDYIKNNEETFARAWLDGYTVEEEQKYRVEDSHGRTILAKMAYSHKGERFNKVEPYNELIVGYKKELTEQEIKDYDKRYMSFAKPVEELEE